MPLKRKRLCSYRGTFNNKLKNKMIFSKVLNDTLFNIPVVLHKRVSTFTFYDESIRFADCFKKWFVNTFDDIFT